MKISLANILITVFITKALAAVVSGTGSRSPMEVGRDTVLELNKEENAKACIICSGPLMGITEKKHLEDNDDFVPSLASCPNPSQHVTHTKCLLRWLSRKFSCIQCRRNCTEPVRQVLFVPGVGSQEFKKELLAGLVDDEMKRGNAIDFFEQLLLFPDEFTALEQKLREQGEKSATAVGALDEVWHMQLGIPILSRCFKSNDIDLPEPHKFYDDLRAYMNNDSQTMAEAISLINTVYIGYDKIKLPYQLANRAYLINGILNAFKHNKSDNEIYDLSMIFAEHGDRDRIFLLIENGRFIRNISAEKIIKMLECLRGKGNFKNSLFLAIWTMAGACREFAPEDMQAIMNCLRNIYAEVGGPRHVDAFMSEITVMLKNNEGECALAHKHIANYVENL